MENIREDVFVEAKIGDGFIVLLNKAGDVYTMGESVHGELGNMDSFHDKLTRVIKIPFCKSVYAGRSYCLAVTEEGNLIGWGHNKDGQLLMGNRILPIQSGSTDIGLQIKPF